MKVEALNLSTMHSGDLCLELSEHINWEAFPDYVAEVLKRIGGKVVGKNDGPDMRIWDIELQAHQLRIVYEDYPQMVSIEPNNQAGNELLKSLYEQLKS